MLELKDWKVVVGFDGSAVIGGMRAIDAHAASAHRRAVGRDNVRATSVQRNLARERGMRDRAHTTALRQMDKERRARERIEDTKFRASLKHGNRASELGSYRGTRQGSFDAVRLQMARRNVEMAKTIRGTTRAVIVENQLAVAVGKSARAYNKANGALRKHGGIANSVSLSVRNLVRSYASVFAIGAGIKGFYNIGTKFDSMQAALLAGSGSAEVAGENFEFLVKTSRRLGVSLSEGAQGFNILSIAATASGFKAEEIRTMYLGVAEASAAFQLSVPKQNLVFLAMSQLASKARVSMQELQRQMGDSMPIAIEAMRKSYSKFKGEEISRNQLINDVSKGLVNSKDVIVEFGKAMSEGARSGGALEAAVKKVAARAEMARTELILAIKGSFGKNTKQFSAAWDNIKASIKTLTPVIEVFGTVLATVFNGLAITLRVISPILALVAIPINNITKLISMWGSSFDGLDKKAADSLSGFERTLYTIEYLIIKTQLAWMDLRDLLTIGDGDSGLVATLKVLGSSLLGAAGAVVAYKTLKTFLGGIFSLGGLATKAIVKMGLRAAGIGLPGAVAGAGLGSSSAIGLLATWLPRIAKGVGALGAAFGVGYGIGTIIHNMIDDTKLGIALGDGIGKSVDFITGKDSSPNVPLNKVSPTTKIEINNNFKGASEEEARRASKIVEDVFNGKILQAL